MPETNWVTGEACLWFDNDEGIYHESRRLIQQSLDNGSAGGSQDRYALELLLRRVVPSSDFGVIEQIREIDWDVVVDHIITDLREGYE